MNYRIRMDPQFLFLGKARSKETGQPVVLASIGNGVVRLLSLLPAFVLYFLLQQHHQALAFCASLLLLLVLLPFNEYVVGCFAGWVRIGSPQAEKAATHSLVLFRGAILLLALIFCAIWLLSA